jgi:cell division protein FtsQ
MSVTVPSDRRFRRSRSRPVKRTRLRSRWWWQLLRSTAVVGALACGGYEVALFAVSAPSLTVRHIVLDGNNRVSTGEAGALLDGLKGENILAADLELWRDRLRASSWVADAELRRRLPATIVIHITEREPIGIARLRDELFLVDGSGGVIDEFGPRYADCNLPIIDGLLVPGEHGSKVDDVRGRLVAAMMADVKRRPEVARMVSQIDVTNARDVKVLLDGDPALIRLGDAHFLERIWSYVGLQASLRERVPAIDYVDLRFDNRVYVGPSAAVPASGPAVAVGASTTAGTALPRRP